MKVTITNLENDSLDWPSAWKEQQCKPGDSAHLPERWDQYRGTRSLARISELSRALIFLQTRGHRFLQRSSQVLRPLQEIYLCRCLKEI